MAASTACGSMWIAVISMEKAELSRELQISSRILGIGLFPLTEPSPDQRRLAAAALLAQCLYLSAKPCFLQRSSHIS